MSTISRPGYRAATQLPVIRTWLRKIRGGGQIVETCPEYCAGHQDHEKHGYLVDLAHVGEHHDFTLPVWDSRETSIDMPVLSARIFQAPYSDDEADRIPHIVFEPWQDEPMVNLDPDQFAAVIAKIRAHCDRLDQVHAQLVQARADYEGAMR